MIKTVKVVNPKDPTGGFMTINQSDFDPTVHKPWSPKPAGRAKLAEGESDGGGAAKKPAAE